MELKKQINKIINDKKDTNYLEYKKQVLEKIIKLEEIYYRISLLDIKSLKLFNKNIKVKKQLNLVIVALKDLYNDLIRLNKIIYKKHLDKDLKFNNKIINILLNSLDINSKTRIDIIDSIKDIIKEKEKEDYNVRRNIKYILFHLKNVINNEKNKKLKKENIKCDINKKRKIESSENIELDECDYAIYDNILNGQSVDHYKTLDIIKNFRYLIRYGEIKSSTINYVNTICDRILSENKINDEEYLYFLHSILDSIKYRKQVLEKNDKKEKIILKECKTIFERFIKDIELKNKKCDIDIDYKFDIIFELLSSYKFYHVIKRLVNEYPKIVNIRKDNMHIVIYILDEYIKNYKLLLKKCSSYKNIDYIREVYNLFTKNEYMYLTEKETKIINKMINSFIDYVRVNVKSSIRKNHIINEAISLLPKNYYNENDIELREFNMYSFDTQLSYIKNSTVKYKNFENQVDLTKEDTFMLLDDYTCYSLINNKDTKSIKIHTCDISNLITRYKALDSYMYNSLLLNNPLNNDILDVLKFKLNEIVSALTYEIILDNTNKVIGFKIYKSKIKLDRILDDSTENDKLYNELRLLCNNITINQNYEIKKLNIKRIEEVIKHLLNDTYMKNIKVKDIPYIFSGVEKISSIEDITIYSNIKTLFTKLKKEEVIIIDNILNEELDEFHYSNKPFEVTGEYNLYLTGIPNYLMLQNQRIIKTLYLNERNLSLESYNREKRIFKIEFDNIIMDLNSILGFIGYDDLTFETKNKKKKFYIPKTL